VHFSWVAETVPFSHGVLEDEAAELDADEFAVFGGVVVNACRKWLVYPHFTFWLW
jgi:hypothetical protein